MSPQEWIVVAAGAVLLLLVVALSVALVRAQRVARQSNARLTARVEALESAVAPSQTSSGPAPDPAYVITGLGQSEREGESTIAASTDVAVHTGRIDGALFTDIVARETAIKAAGLAHGVRRALAPETRNRIRFAMRTEVKRARKQRRADLKAALRDLQARERAAKIAADLPQDSRTRRADGEDAA